LKSKLKGQKDRKGKILVNLVLPDFILGIAETLTFGANKYAPNTWQNIDEPIETHYGAVLRHLLAWRSGEIKDPESGIHHLKHAASNIMFLLDHEKEGRK